MERTVLIAVKKTDDFFLTIGMLDKQTDDYNLACILLNKLTEEGIRASLYNTDNTFHPSDMDIINEASILIVVALSSDHLKAAKSVVKAFTENYPKKIIFLHMESPRSLPKSLLQPYLNSNSLSESYVVHSSTTFHALIKDVLTYFQHAETKKAYTDPTVLRLLKRAMPLSENLSHITKREWLDHLLDQWITGTSAKRVCWLNGEHGSGKTSFIGDYCARLKSGNKDGIIGGGIYYCSSTDTRTQNTIRIIQTIAYELCQCINGYGKAINDTILDDQFSNLGPENMLQELLLDPFIYNPSLVPRPEDGRFVFAIDGIDELKTNRFDALDGFLNLLRPLKNLSQFIRIIITSTPDKNIENTMTQIHAERIDLTTKHFANQQLDAERFLCNELNSRKIDYTYEEVQKILTQAEWNFDYLQHFIAQCDDDNNGRLPPLDQLPKGLLAMYEADFSQIFVQQYYQDKVKPILQILAVAYEPLTISALAQILQMERNEIISIFSSGRVAQFLRFSESKHNDNVVSLYSASLESWLAQKGHYFSIDIQEGKSKIIDWIQKDCNSEKKYYSFYKNDYLQKYGLHHLLDDCRTNMIKELIHHTNPDNFEKLKASVGFLFIQNDTRFRAWSNLLLCVFQDSFDHKVRDIIVYSYRYILKRRGLDNPILQQLVVILKNKDEVIRAELLLGEGQDDYQNAKTHFTTTIALAEKMVYRGRVNKWWDIRMLGVAYNRLANLENKNGNHLQAQKMYMRGKEQFQDAEEHFINASDDMQNKYRDDIDIIRRDLGISNERLGDLQFGSGCYESAVEYYQEFYDTCRNAYTNQTHLRTKWDLSISLLRLGDAQCYRGKTADAQKHYKNALNLRREILQHMRSDCMDVLPRPFYIEFSCPEMATFNCVTNMPLIKESRDIDPIRDIAMCYARLGDLAYSLSQPEIASEYYDIFSKLCEKYDQEVQTKSSERDFEISKLRKALIVNNLVEN